MPIHTLQSSSSPSSSGSTTRTYTRRSTVSVPTLFLEGGTTRTPLTRRNTIVQFGGRTPNTKVPPNTLLAKFIESFKELETYKHGKKVIIDGQTLSIAAVTAASRYNASVSLSSTPAVKSRVDGARDVMSYKVDNGISVYGVSTGFGGSADTRTDQPLILGHALLQMQHCGVLPSDTEEPLTVLPLSDPMGMSMPESWVRGAILIRMNSLIRGHSGVRWELIEKMNELLAKNVTPLVPLRGSISASGDLSPLSYIAGTLVGNPSVRAFCGPSHFGARAVLPSPKALASQGITPLPLASKEHLGILNGTAFSASVASLALNDAVHLALLTQILTAMGTEALYGNRGSFHNFIHGVARPHPGQVESARIIWDLLEGSQFAITQEEEVKIEDDKGKLRQDRYPLRTAPQFIGPQLEDLLASLATITQECNSTTDNPLIDSSTGHVHHGGNFQAMAVTNAMEKTRLSLHHFGKILFAQCAELINPAMNRGLAPNAAATDPSLDYHAKGVDIAMAAYVAELGWLASPVSTHIQSAEMHNQAVNSMALVSGRATINSLEVLSMIVASYLYILCQALDLRAMQKELDSGIQSIISQELSTAFAALAPSDLSQLTDKVSEAIQDSLEHTTTMDAAERMEKVAGSTTSVIVNHLMSLSTLSPTDLGTLLLALPSFRSTVSSRSTALVHELRQAYLTGQRGPAPASRFLNKTRPVYEFVRIKLGVKMRGLENLSRFENGHGLDEDTVGQSVSLIFEAIRDGKMQPVVLSLFE